MQERKSASNSKRVTCFMLLLSPSTKLSKPNSCHGQFSRLGIWMPLHHANCVYVVSTAEVHRLYLKVAASIARRIPASHLSDSIFSRKLLYWFQVSIGFVARKLPPSWESAKITPNCLVLFFSEHLVPFNHPATGEKFMSADTFEVEKLGYNYDKLIPQRACVVAWVFTLESNIQVDENFGWHMVYGMWTTCNCWWCELSRSFQQLSVVLVRMSFSANSMQ